VQVGHDVDEYVIRAATAGDARAQEAIYRHYHQRIYRLAYRMMGQEADAQDVTQDSFVRCFEALAQYRGDAGLWAWMKPITIRTALMRLRVRRRWNWFQGQDSDAEGGESMIELIGDEQPGPEREAQRSDLHKAMAQLNSTARAVIYLYHVEGYSHADIAAMWGKSLSFSKSQLARAQRRLRELLEAFQVSPESDTRRLRQHNQPPEPTTSAHQAMTNGAAVAGNEALNAGAVERAQLHPVKEVLS